MTASHRAAGSEAATPSRRYYGWIIVATLCVTETITWGVIYSTSFARRRISQAAMTKELMSAPRSFQGSR